MAAKKRRPDLTTRVLIEIRDEVRRTNERLDQTNRRLDGTNERLMQMGDRLDARLDQTNGRLAALERRQTETEIRLATELVAVTHAVNGVRDLLRDNLQLHPRLDDHEQRLTALENERG